MPGFENAQQGALTQQKRMHADNVSNPLQTARETQVPGQFSRLSKGMENLLDRIQRLETRLTHVLRPIGPETTGQTTERQQLVPLASQLSNFADTLDIATMAIDSITDRLEL